jgi:transcriptional regulator with XRE-family HTH domain
MSNRYADNYSANLKRYLEAEEISTNSLANKSNISQKTIWVVQAGKSVPTVNTVQQISKALGIDSRMMLSKELTVDQLRRTVKLGKIMDDLIEMSAEQVAHFAAVAKAFTSN